MKLGEVTVFYKVSFFGYQITVYSLKSVGIVTEFISDHNDTNKRNNYLND